MSDLISRKGVFIPDITVEMFRNASLESIEDLMASGEMEDILLPSAQPEQRWIPCSERLPEEGEDIIVTYVDDEEMRIIPVNYDKGTWYDCIFDTALNPIKVIAWMPLPEPYREERTEE